MDVKNKRVVVTGAASGIGKALCEAFHQAGAKFIFAVLWTYFFFTGFNCIDVISSIVT